MQAQENVWNKEDLINTLSSGGVVIMPTDTIYGIVGKAQDKNTVNRIYSIRNRNLKKPCIILIGDINELEKFSIVLLGEQKKILEKYWFLNQSSVFQPTSIVLDCIDDSLEYLHRGTKTLAFRVPQSQGLRDLLLKTGPLIAPSANKETFPPNHSMEDARRHFGNSVDLYINIGELKGKAS